MVKVCRSTRRSQLNGRICRVRLKNQIKTKQITKKIIEYKCHTKITNLRILKSVLTGFYEYFVFLVNAAACKFIPVNNLQFR